MWDVESRSLAKFAEGASGARWLDPLRSSVSIVMRRCAFKTFTPSSPDDSRGGVYVPPRNAYAKALRPPWWGSLGWPQVGEFGRPPGTQTVTAPPVFERAFREHGLRIAIRTDNGVPFATQAIHHLSYLNVWWMRLGIVHQRSRLGCPQDNGAHERMHRTLKRQAIKHVRTTCAAQQRNFDAFRTEYNEERPHERLGQETPASHYTSSVRAYSDRLPPLEYPRHFIVKKITTGGTFRFQHKLLYLANAMVDQHIGLEETDDGIWAIHFNTVLLATFDERDYIING
jgi:hypothetical protein